MKISSFRLVPIIHKYHDFSTLNIQAEGRKQKLSFLHSRCVLKVLKGISHKILKILKVRPISHKNSKILKGISHKNPTERY